MNERVVLAVVWSSVQPYLRVWAAAGQRSGPHTHTHVWAAPDGPAASAERGGPAAHGEAALKPGRRAAHSAEPRPVFLSSVVVGGGPQLGGD